MAWLRAFKAKMRVGDKKDNKEDNKLDITDSFLACAGCDAVEKITNIVAPNEPESLEFTDIEQALIRYLEPEQKLVISERAKFFSVVHRRRVHL